MFSEDRRNDSCSGDPEKLKELIFNDPAFRNLDIEAYNVIVHYTYARDLFKLRDEVKKGEKNDMCQAWATMIERERNLGKDDGMREGKVVGLREGKASSVLELLSEHSAISETLSDRIRAENDLSVLTGWLKLAAKAETLEDFVKGM